MARMGCIGSAAVVLFGVAAAAMAAPSSVPATATPTTATVGVATPVVVTSLIADTTFISANLLRTDATGRSLSIVGTLHDDGLNGDAVAGDRVFSYRANVNETATGKVYYRVSAAFRGVLARVLSSVVAIDIVPLKTTPQITLTLAPSPVNGWSRLPVTAHYTCTPQGSVIVSCPQDQVFSTDGTGFVATGTATDATGGTATATSQPFGVDQSAPGITVVLSPNVAQGSWTNQQVTAHFTCTDGLSGVASCPPDQTLSSEGANQAVVGTTTDAAGNTASTQMTVSIDRTAPTLSVALSPAPDAGGIYRSAVTAHFTCADALSGVATCPPDQLFSTAGTGFIATGVATDAAGNSVSLSSNPFTLQFAVPTITVTLSPAANANGWNNGPVTAHFTCDENGQPIAGCPADIVTSTEGANLTVSGTVTNANGVSASVTSGLFNIDLTPPVLALGAPNGATSLFVSPVSLTGSATDALSGVDTVTCNSTPAALFAASVSCSVALTQGLNTIAADAVDRAGNQATLSLSLQYTRVPQVTITSPLPSSYLNLSPTTVTGTVDDPTAAVVVNGLAAPVANGQFSMILPLAEGPNTVAATATSAGGAAGTASIQVTLDTTPPHISINSPPDQFETTDDLVTISGIINDIVVGTVNPDQAQVSVNGVSAQVANRTFARTDVPLQLGPNVIQAVGRDRVGNFATTSVTVTRLAPAGLAKITLVSGNNQTAPIRAPLNAPLVVRVTDAAGAPAASQQVVFKVTQNDGLITTGAAPAVTVLATTDAQGQASVQWTLGGRAGAGGNTVEAYSVGFDGTAIFTATGVNGTPGKIVVDTGNNQLGPIGQPLPKPFIAVVVDDGNNRLGNIPVTFRVADGGGTINGNDFETVITDSDGRAAVTLTLGTQEGEANNLVSADFAGNQGFPAAFTASGRYPGDPTKTTISGVVLDNTNAPIPGVTVRAVLTNVMNSNGTATQTAPSTQTDGQGQFTLTQAPVGLIKLLVDGGTASVPGPYPSLEYDTVTVAGNVNTVGQPIFLVPLNTANSLCVTDTTGGGTLTIPEAPGFSLTFGPGQVTFPGGSKSGCVSVTVVNREKVPMAPGFGQQPRFIVTIQPSGALFNPPAPITLPNVDGLAPREVTEMYSFDHDVSAFVAIGTGIVSDDGSVIRSATGVGVLKAGWHCGGNPNQIGGAAQCPVCFFCPGSLSNCQPQGNGTACGNGGTCQFGRGCVNGGPCAQGFTLTSSGQCCQGSNCTRPCPSPMVLDPNTGQCAYPGPCPTGYNLVNGQCCTGTSCAPPTCQSQCNSGNPCITDSCGPGGQCSHTPNQVCNSACNNQADGSSCTVSGAQVAFNGTCDNGSCDICNTLGQGAACNAGGASPGVCAPSANGQLRCTGTGNQCPTSCAGACVNGRCTSNLTLAISPDPVMVTVAPVPFVSFDPSTKSYTISGSYASAATKSIQSTVRTSTGAPVDGAAMSYDVAGPSGQALFDISGGATTVSGMATAQLKASGTQRSANGTLLSGTTSVTVTATHSGDSATAQFQANSGWVVTCYFVVWEGDSVYPAGSNRAVDLQRAIDFGLKTQSAYLKNGVWYRNDLPGVPGEFRLDFLGRVREEGSGIDVGKTRKLSWSSGRFNLTAFTGDVYGAGPNPLVPMQSVAADDGYWRGRVSGGGSVAAPVGLTFGTQLDSDIGPLVVMDRGVAIIGYHLDLYTGIGQSTCGQWGNYQVHTVNPR